MPTRKIRRTQLLALAVAALTVPATAALAAPVPADAAAAPTAPLAAPATTASTTTAPATAVAASPTGFLNLPTSLLPTDRAPHEISFQYRNDSAGDQSIAPQVLIESPVGGPFLVPTAVSLQVETSDGSWLPLPLGIETGTLYTNLIPAKLVLHSHHTLTEHYRLTVLSPSLGTVAPRIAFYG
ncbi:signal peptide protein [Kitasatospora sp. LaBMicrA B282]|uniref:signal peptide protein n=1 Tax=Kitasatospora sp. LaBMicrA B282 TaxID=3420949 RepID=UPI003D0D762E